ncbi:MAG TPA: sigma-54 dependent transcriptional regulator [Gemmatimonadales bacterium]|jgi:two-component system response regulator HydG|nr:sigma-54 dependent transcriptional regulator [Gemmatimonadales bacterium]
MTDSVLLLHDDPSLLRSIGARFEQAGCEVHRELNVETGVATLDRTRPDVVCMAIHLARGVPELVRRLAAREAPVIAFGDRPDPVEAAAVLLAGASRVADTAADLDLLLTLAQRGAAEGRERRVADALIRSGSPRFGADSLGSSTGMRQLAQQIGLLAQSERTTLLLMGETGVGKAWAARTIHDLSVRAGKPFFEIQLGGRNPTYLESQVFGHEKGAFVEATERRRGLLELADGGTLLLREIADLPAELQPKLLRVLETRTFRRVGGTQDINVDTRLMVTTRRELGQAVEAEKFRQDLYYRLSVMPLALPALRERTPEDRQLLLTAIHGALQPLYPEGPQAISVEAADRFLTYAWPGNVREMEQVLERSLIIARGQVTINVEHLPGEFRARPGLGDRRHTPMSLDVLEHQHIERTLRYHGGNRTRAARELGISRATLINKIKVYSITD